MDWFALFVLLLVNCELELDNLQSIIISDECGAKPDAHTAYGSDLALATSAMVLF